VAARRRQAGCKRVQLGVYIDESIFEAFEAKTGIKVNYDTYESNEACTAF
jgi:spermidine/putrescine-binding protein